MITLNPTLFQYSHLFRLLLGLTTRFSRGEREILREIKDNLADLQAFPKKDRVDLVVVVMLLLVHEDMWTTMRKTGIVQLFYGTRTGLQHVDLLPVFHSTLLMQIGLHEHF